MRKEKLISLLKSVAKKIYREGFPGWIFSAITFFVAVGGWILAGFGIGEFMTLVTSKDNYIVTLYFIAMGGTMSNSWVKRWIGDPSSGLPSDRNQRQIQGP